MPVFSSTQQTTACYVDAHHVADLLDDQRVLGQLKVSVARGIPEGAPVRPRCNGVRTGLSACVERHVRGTRWAER